MSKMAGKLSGKVALVTRAGSGIGRATALMFSREGAKVVIVDISDQGGKETLELTKGADGTAIFVNGDTPARCLFVTKPRQAQCDPKSCW
jgi:NAD(P)-dependent dehydrogenase (short-subunit alcohol dehydrogenase family)